MKSFRLLCLILLLMGILLLPGCWDYIEYEDLALLTALGFDKGPEGQITLISLYNPVSSSPRDSGAGGQGPSGENASVVVNQASSSSVSTAIDKLQEIISKQIFLGDIGLIVISDQITPEEMRKIISFLDTTQYIRPSTFVAVCKGKASDYLSTQTSSGISYMQTIDLISNTNGAAIPVTILQLMQKLEREGSEPILPMVEAEAQPEESKSENSEGMGNQPKTSSSEGSKTSNVETDKPVLGSIRPKMGNLKISGLAVLKGYQLVGQLDETETRGVIWIINQKFNGHVGINFQGNMDTTAKPKAISFKISDFRTKRKIILNGGLPQVLLNVNVKAILEEFRYSRKALPPALEKTMEKKLADSIELTMEKSIAKAQSLHSDIFGFGYDMFHQHLREWKRTYRNQWDQVFPKLAVKIRVKVEILNTGTKLPSILVR